VKDLQREILSQVATGKISAEEGAARLEALESPAEEAPTSVAPAPTPTAGIREVRVRSRFGNAEIIGDASISGAVADGPHRARQEGDVLVIEQSPLTGETSFEFSRRHARVVVNGLDVPNVLTVRMNPSLPLTARVQAGNLRVKGLTGPIAADVQAGSCNVDGFGGPVTLSAMAGNIDAFGKLDGGKSSIRCQMGEVNLGLARGSSVRLRTRSTMGDVAIEGAGVRKDGGEILVGSGAGTLDLDTTFGSIKVNVE